MLKRSSGIIGLGMAARKYVLALAGLAGLAGGAEIVVAWSPCRERHGSFAAAHHIPVVVEVRQVRGDPSISRLRLLTPPWTHLGLLGEAVRASVATGREAFKMHCPIGALMRPGKSGRAEMRAAPEWA
ncbi:hypothetical protein QMO56_04260 [Roseomonas sp. E05]|uniref:hypothetical protein n=1 Tax=Roseomonas sp. E05 TaxID=3046310 RepID=UPI0024B93DC0|nr:hypothetical protein [Roseomonas sp. E05]MDJ0387320.1 hypothetical protein [Roseomonas sp. E05]